MSLFDHAPFIGHTGRKLEWKIDCDALTNSDIETLAWLIARRVSFSDVHGIPNGGLRLAAALRPYRTDTSDFLLIVDDVLTTGGSMEAALKELKPPNAAGIVIFARGPCPAWVSALFSLADWAKG